MNLRITLNCTCNENVIVILLSNNKYISSDLKEIAMDLLTKINAEEAKEMESDGVLT